MASWYDNSRTAPWTHFVLFILLNVLLCGCIALEQQLLTINLQSMQEANGTKNPFSILELTEAKSFWLLGLWVLGSFPGFDLAACC